MISRLGVMGSVPLSHLCFLLSICGLVIFSFTAITPISDPHPLGQSILIIDQGSFKLKGENICHVEFNA